MRLIINHSEALLFTDSFLTRLIPCMFSPTLPPPPPLPPRLGERCKGKPKIAPSRLQILGFHVTSTERINERCLYSANDSSELQQALANRTGIWIISTKRSRSIVLPSISYLRQRLSWAVTVQRLWTWSYDFGKFGIFSNMKIVGDSAVLNSINIR